MPYITPEAVMRDRFDDNPRPEWATAVLCHRDLEGSRLLVEGLGAERLGYQVLWGMYEFPGSPPHAHQVLIGQARVGVIARCHWGGPQAAMLVEELAYLGVTRIIGIGACGSIDPGLPKGSQVVVDTALTTDGTSRAYTDEAELGADPQLRALALSAGEKLSCRVHIVRAVATDAIYRETEDDVIAWRSRGAQVVNMETSALYAASAICGIRSVWIGHVSDCLVGSEWEQWTDVEDMAVVSARLGLEMLMQLHGSSAATSDPA